MRKIIPMLVLIQFLTVLGYLLYGQIGDNMHQYFWGVVFHVSNQLFVAGYIYIALKRPDILDYHSRLSLKIAFWFNVFLAILWSNYYIPGLPPIIKYVGQLKIVLGYLVICFSLYVFCIFREK